MAASLKDIFDAGSQNVRDWDARLLADITSSWDILIPLNSKAEFLALAREAAQKRADGVPFRVEDSPHYKAALDALNSGLAQFTPLNAERIKSQQARFLGYGVLNTWKYIQAAAKASSPASQLIPQVSLAQPELAFLVGRMYNGDYLADYLKRSWNDAAQGMTQALLKGYMRGDSAEDLVNAMYDGSRRGLTRVLTTARSESYRVYREGQRLQMASAGILYYERQCAFHHSCVACMLADGRVYKTAEFMPSHPRCKCELVPILADWATVDTEDKNPGDSAVHPTYQKTAARYNAQDQVTHTAPRGLDRFQKLPTAQQIEALGPERYNAWKAGRIDLADVAGVQDHGKAAHAQGSAQAATLEDGASSGSGGGASAWLDPARLLALIAGEKAANWTATLAPIPLTWLLLGAAGIYYWTHKDRPDQGQAPLGTTQEMLEAGYETADGMESDLEEAEAED